MLPLMVMIILVAAWAAARAFRNTEHEIVAHYQLRTVTDERKAARR